MSLSIPPSPHFTPLPLTGTFNHEQSSLPTSLRAPANLGSLHGEQAFLGIPFLLGPHSGANVIYLDGQEVAIDAGERKATYVLFLHVVEDRATNYLDDLNEFYPDGNDAGDPVSEYTLEYASGAATSLPVLRRFGIQQGRIQWGASAFAAMPARSPVVSRSASEDFELRRVASQFYGRGETRHTSGRTGELLWIYAMPNPHPDQPIRRIVCRGIGERSAIYAVTLAHVREHPLRPGVRRKLRLTLPPEVSLNALHELDDIAIDLGTVISARAELQYDREQWLSRQPIVQPQRSTNSVIVEYSAHPQAKLYVGRRGVGYAVYDLDADNGPDIVHVAPATRPVRLRVIDKATQRPVPVRLHIHGEAGEYLPPRGHHRKVNPYWFEDNYGEFVNVHNQYAYINGECEVDVPLGNIYVEATRGYEVSPLRTVVEIGPETEEVTLEIERVLHWRERGWVSADTHVHFLSPQTALLEGKAEDVHVVNLLASQWGEMYSNVTDFDGCTTLGSREFGGDGEFLVRVGTENRMQTLGHISLLGYSGAMIHPLCTGGPSESAIGDPQEVTMAEWAQRCIDQGGLVVMPHAPNPQLERAADFVLGLVHATEMMSHNPIDPSYWHVSPWGLVDWYRYLNMGYQIPVVGGSDKMSASMLLGGMRTYAHLGGREFTYENWMQAIRAGNTFVTVGPMVSMSVEGVEPGGQVRLPTDGGTVQVEWVAESATVPIDEVEIVAGGYVVGGAQVDGTLAGRGSLSYPVTKSTWIAVRVRGSWHGKRGDIAAHTSAVQVLVGDQPLFSEPDAMAVLTQIEGALAYLDTLAPRPEAQRFKMMRATIEAAYNRLHQRLHRAGVFHQHAPLHGHAHEH